MRIRKIDKTGKILKVEIPLTRGTGKSRIKKRSSFNEYGIPVPTKTEEFSDSCYVEWQIGYYEAVGSKANPALTTLPNETIINDKGETKTLYELSEYIYYFYKWGIIKKTDLNEIQSFLAGLTSADFIDNPHDCAIKRTPPIGKTVCGIDFAYTQVQYPMLIYLHCSAPDPILTEIKTTETQYAMGVQPMLYFCFPITEFVAVPPAPPLIGRTAETKETADFIITKENIYIFLEMLKIFGILSAAHNHDVQEIIKVILASAP